MIKVLFLSNYIGKNKGGGIATVVRDLMYLWNDNYIDISLWFRGSNNYNTELVNYKKIIDKVKLIGLFGKSNNHKLYLSDAIKQLKDVDIIHRHCLWEPFSILSLYSSIIKKKKVVIQPHGTLSEKALQSSSYKKKIAFFLYENLNLKSASLLIANSTLELNDIKKKFPSKEVALIPHGISMKFIEAQRSVENRFVSVFEDKKIISYISRIHPIKGIERLIEAASKTEGLEDYVFAIGGNGEDKYINDLKRKIEFYNLSDKFIFLGNLDYNEKIDLLDISTFFILPSFSENFSISIVEAMGRGVPVMTTKGTPWQEIDKEECGFWVDNTIEGLKAGLKAILSTSESSRRKYAQSAKKLVIEKYIIEKNILKYDELYKYLMGNISKPEFIS